jgi:hypothetical protein
MTGTSSAKPRFALIPGHDEEIRHRGDSVMDAHASQLVMPGLG